MTFFSNEVFEKENPYIEISIKKGVSFFKWINHIHCQIFSRKLGNRVQNGFFDKISNLKIEILKTLYFNRKLENLV